MANKSFDYTQGLVQLSNIASLASGANAAQIVTAVNALLADLKSKGYMVADSE